MKHTYLEITYRRGRAVAAYFYLPRRDHDASVRTESVGDGLVIDFTADGRAIGIEILTPNRVDFTALDAAFVRVGCSPISREELAPLTAA
jgi:uncharacterized protein YuzE